MCYAIIRVYAINRCVVEWIAQYHIAMTSNSNTIHFFMDGVSPDWTAPVGVVLSGLPICGPYALHYFWGSEWGFWPRCIYYYAYIYSYKGTLHLHTFHKMSIKRTDLKFHIVL